ncbi:hypothetical protein GCM10009838_22000 [Catenulispora subtropica]|uniref:histidine kinase n=2 Tax=Catenulispora subtropica TaxID=450798 RepID=A0ABP5CN43_9ACTN
MRWRLAVLFSVFNVAGLAVLGTVAVAADQNGRSSTLRTQIRGMAALAADHLSDVNGTLTFDESGVEQDFVDGITVYVFTRDPSGAVKLFDTAGDGPIWGPELLADSARWAVRHNDETAFTDVTGPNGSGLLLAVPFYHSDGTDGTDGEPIGAIVAVGDPDAQSEDHERLVWAVVAAGAALTVTAGVGGFLLARRSVRLAAQALEQQERFLTDAAHELRTPLAAIRAAAEAAGPEPARHSATLSQVAARAAGMSGTVDGLLLRARHAAGLTHSEPERLRLDLLVEDVAADEVPEPHRLIAQLAPTVVRADPALLRMAVRNLLDNAVRHGRGDIPAVVEVSVQDTSVSIHDYGPGVGASGPREGVGLSLARWVAELHHAELTVADHPNGGTVATLRLPSDQ